MKQSPIDIPEAVQMGSASASKPLVFTDYQNVKFDKQNFQIIDMFTQVRVTVFGNTIEHYGDVDGNGDRMTNNNLLNNGHTAVS